MPVTVVNSDTACDSLGASFRRALPGPERRLIEWFLDAFPFRIPASCRATVFCEPRLESGFPDLVVVIWNIRVTTGWTDARRELTHDDLRLLHYLHCNGRTQLTALVDVFGRHVRKSLERLQTARTARSIANDWVALSLATTFAARRIIAIEAKINEWATALEQAALNTWFASESYVLVPRIPRGNRLREEAVPQGVGVYTQSDDLVAVPATPSDNLPRSYASWVLNDWAWRASAGQ